MLMRSCLFPSCVSTLKTEISFTFKSLGIDIRALSNRVNSFPFSFECVSQSVVVMGGSSKFGRTLADD